ncbi:MULTISPECIES: hypothetical protein [Legionella]|uniref:Uncharacterized protein n=1 Tax=Legionella maceachernii TaxID=466 RepID=A0A0W0W3Q8_9GAMM|nr:hypothetical protein [Legionella maceachernii]KTD27088.1 hypothetical protein Lmac_1336 [Legionella maceachernii]SKA04708.1 hypothetical protein SAMN02745128_01894 [Legionella maceachernii]SUP00299.1 Uncharacterised protein [Legionella maceachernii]
MKFFIEKVTYISGATPTIGIYWRLHSPKTPIFVDYYPWTNYPYEEKLEEFKPHFYREKRGVTLFKAPNQMTKQEIRSHNIRYYESDPEDITPKTKFYVVYNLEKAGEEIESISNSHYLYFMKHKEKKRVFTLQEVEITQGIYSNDDAKIEQRDPGELRINR